MLGHGNLSLTAELFLTHRILHSSSQRRRPLKGQTSTHGKLLLPTLHVTDAQNQARSSISSILQIFFLCPPFPGKVTLLRTYFAKLCQKTTWCAVLHSSEGHSTRMWWSDKTSRHRRVITNMFYTIAQNNLALFKKVQWTTVVTLLPTSTYFMCNKRL